MEKAIQKIKNHYLVCGMTRVGACVLQELIDTNRACVLIDRDERRLGNIKNKWSQILFILGDATDDAVLDTAGIQRAAGVFAATDDDNINLVISLSAKQLNPHVRVVASCHDADNFDKMRKAGADAVISPTRIGGLRMASEMIRPTVVSFLDTMLRDRNMNLRVEEIMVPETFPSQPLHRLSIDKFQHTMILAIRTDSHWLYKPHANQLLAPHDTLVVMTTPDEYRELQRLILK